MSGSRELRRIAGPSCAESSVASTDNQRCLHVERASKLTLRSGRWYEKHFEVATTLDYNLAKTIDVGKLKRCRRNIFPSYDEDYASIKNGGDKSELQTRESNRRRKTDPVNKIHSSTFKSKVVNLGRNENETRKEIPRSSILNVVRTPPSRNLQFIIDDQSNDTPVVKPQEYITSIGKNMSTGRYSPVVLLERLEDLPLNISVLGRYQSKHGDVSERRTRLNLDNVKRSSDLPLLAVIPLKRLKTSHAKDELSSCTTRERRVSNVCKRYASGDENSEEGDVDNDDDDDYEVGDDEEESEYEESELEFDDENENDIRDSSSNVSSSDNDDSETDDEDNYAYIRNFDYEWFPD